MSEKWVTHDKMEGATNIEKIFPRHEDLIVVHACLLATLNFHTKPRAPDDNLLKMSDEDYSREKTDDIHVSVNFFWLVE